MEYRVKVFHNTHELRHNNYSADRFFFASCSFSKTFMGLECIIFATKEVFTFIVLKKYVNANH